MNRNEAGETSGKGERERESESETRDCCGTEKHSQKTSCSPMGLVWYTCYDGTWERVVYWLVGNFGIRDCT